ncbi:MAG: geranylgeranyl reductase [Bacteroidetes bacterium]|nr:MAG: geranylgeranyl reductase [Bacteroidota bacterium]
MSQQLETEVVIIGAGPAGCGASLYLSQFNIPHVVLEKETYPRDKVCGDALSGKVINQLKKLNPDWLDELKLEEKAFTPSWGVLFSAPDGNEIRIPFKHKPSEADHSPGFVTKRLDYDYWLFKKLDKKTATVLEGQEVKDVVIDNFGVTITSSNYEVKAKLLISAEGTRATVAKKYCNYKMEHQHHCAGLRAYYDGVTGLDQEGFIELHFVKESLPGYFWVFPLPNGQANVGIGMLSKYVSKDKVNLKQVMLDVLESPKFKERFKNAKLQNRIQGWGLPLGSKKNRPISGNRFMLAGDSASLIDPFTGEGIGNAMFSGKWAAEQARDSLTANDFSANALHQYDKTVYKKIGGELRVSTIMQKLIKYPWLFNWMIRKIKRNDELRETITFMFDDVDLRKKFASPLFYLRVLFK